MKCQYCNSQAFLQRRLQTFRNDTQHIRVDCGQCGRFLGFDKQGVASFKEEMFHLVRALSEAELSADNMRFFRHQARTLMGKASDGLTVAPTQPEETPPAS